MCVFQKIYWKTSLLLSKIGKVGYLEFKTKYGSHEGCIKMSIQYQVLKTKHPETIIDHPRASGPHVQVLALHALTVSQSNSCPYLHLNITE